MTLPEYLLTSARGQFALGSHDCATFVGGWVALVCGASPVIPDAETVVAAGARATVRAWRDAAASIGADETRCPVAGDVGVIRDGANAVGAILTPRGWARVRDRAIIVSPARAVIAFALPAMPERAA